MYLETFFNMTNYLHNVHLKQYSVCDIMWFCSWFAILLSMDSRATTFIKYFIYSAAALDIYITRITLFITLTQFFLYYNQGKNILNNSFDLNTSDNWPCWFSLSRGMEWSIYIFSCPSLSHHKRMRTSSNGNISALLAICAGNSPVPGEFPAQSQWRGALMFDLRLE